MLLFLLLFPSISGQARDCLTTGASHCVFPFRYKLTEYSACTWRDNHKTQGVPWCSIRVTADGDHVNSKDGRGSTWDYCSGDCVTHSVSCSPVTTHCSNSSILQQCVERSVPDGVSVSTWCVLMKDDQERTIHVRCPEDCVTYDKTPNTEDYHQPYAGVLGLCAGAGTECLVLLGVSAGLLGTLMVTICVSCVCVRRQKQEGEKMRIRSTSINPGDKVRQSMALS